MVKRIIQSYISIRYVFVLPGLALMVFIAAFFYTSTGNMTMRYIGLFFGAVLAVVMFFYYKEKFSVNRQLKQVKNLKEFDSAVNIGKSFFLEDRMLGYKRNTIYELKYSDITKIKYWGFESGKMFLDLSGPFGLLPVEMATHDQAERVTMFLKTKNPEIVITGVSPDGDGTLHSIDPYRDEKK